MTAYVRVKCLQRNLERWACWGIGRCGRAREEENPHEEERTDVVPGSECVGKEHGAAEWEGYHAGWG